MPASQEGASSLGPSFPFQPTLIHVSDEQLSDLRTRLKRIRWPLGAGNDDWYYGVGRTYLSSDRASWYNHVNITVHDRGGHFIPWEIPHG